MKLLVVEDDAVLRKALTRGLREAGYAVDATGDGAEGLWYARSGAYDGIVLDILLPGMDGLAILRTLRAEGAAAPVLLLTAKDTVDDRVRGLDVGADDYLVKPFAFPELLARVRALVRRGYDRAAPAITLGDLEIDPRARTARRAGRDLQLTAREYALLEYLASRAGQVVSRADIWEHLWDFADESDSNVVEVYISYLRRKLEQNGRGRLIHTRRGMGYVLQEADECDPSAPS